MNQALGEDYVVLKKTSRKEHDVESLRQGDKIIAPTNSTFYFLPGRRGLCGHIRFVANARKLLWKFSSSCNRQAVTWWKGDETGQ